ncbi:6-phosphogluconolactonase [Litorimonas sp. RW-G-Af-16]|uniref:6-phosphogluconolactonase n=1 Tax=Litorimonas sp. RW-G-Af-16 TaxID=3241168 RepID=UPI00390C43C4
MSQSSNLPQEQYFTAGSALTSAAVIWLRTRIETAISKFGTANIFLSGGNSPKPIYEALSCIELPWKAVTISLVDDRWVDESSAGSNTAMIKTIMLQNAASDAQFLPVYDGSETAAQGVEAVEPTMPDRIDICVMGMGMDGHTASWFPDSRGLADAMDLRNTAKLCAINATGCPVAGDYPERITLTRSAVLAARHILLMLPNADKTRVFEAAKTKDLMDAPVAGLLQAGDALTVFAMDSN